MDLKKNFSDAAARLPNTFPKASEFQKAARRFGINKHTPIILYDQKGIYSSPRAWFLFKAMGHEHLAILDGGLPEWIKAEAPTSKSYSQAMGPGDFTASFKEEWVLSGNEVLHAHQNEDYLIIDARATERFLGKVAEPRPHLKRGHIPNARSLPFTDLLEAGKLKASPVIMDYLSSIGVKNQKLIFSCGSGITACIPLIAAQTVLDNPLLLYDGSWSEWGDGDEFPVE